MSSRPLLIAALCLITGVLLAPLWMEETSPLLLAVVALVGLGLLRGRTSRAALAVAGILFGTWWNLQLQDAGRVEGRIRARGYVVSGASGSSTFLALEAIGRPGGPWANRRGRILLRFPERAPPPGVRLVVWGRVRPRSLRALPGAPDPGRILALTRARSELRVQRWARLGRAPTAGTFQPDSSHGGLIRALATGDRTGIADPVLDLFQRTGTRHLLAISGLHLGLVAAAFGWLLTRCVALVGLVRPRTHARLFGAAGAILGAYLYGTMAGWPASALRAAVMTGLGGGLLALERGRDPWNLLGGAALVTVLLDPGSVVSVGWQLSFGALVGLLLVVPRILRWFPPDLSRPVRWLVASMAASVAATVGTLPAVAWWFQELSPVAPVANLLAVPLVGGVATPCAVTALVAPAPIRGVAVWGAELALEAALAWLRLLDVEGLHPAVGPAGALLLLAALLLCRRPGLSALCAVVALGLRNWSRGALVVTFLAVGDGDAILVQWPGGSTWLVDGGYREHDVADYLRRRGIRRLESVVASHGHPDHVNGLVEVVQTLDVDRLWVPRLPGPEEGGFSSLATAARNRGVPVAVPRSSDLPLVRPVGPWTPPRGNDESLVLLLEHAGKRVLLTGDIEAEAEARYAPNVPPVDVLKVPHHGSRTSSTPALLAAARPRLAVISCGGGRGHPHAEVLARYRHGTLLRTDRHGTVEVRISEDGLRLRTWKPGEGWGQRRLSLAEGQVQPLSVEREARLSTSDSMTSSSRSESDSSSPRNR